MSAVTILPPEYWAERVADRDLFELDDNQRLHAERIAQRLMFLDPDADATEIVTYAVKEALQNIPTTREAVKAIAAMRKGHVYCYLAFHGLNGVAEFLKIGMTNHPEMARQLGMVAKEAEAAFSEFSLLRYTDGRAAA